MKGATALFVKRRDHIEYWVKSADNDLAAAEALFESAKYDWCLFIAHLVLEKALKANLFAHLGNLITNKHFTKYAPRNMLKIILFGSRSFMNG